MKLSILGIAYIKPCRGDPAVVSKFSKGWKDRLILWGYICAFEAFLNITILYYTFFPSTWGVNWLMKNYGMCTLSN